MVAGGNRGIMPCPMRRDIEATTDEAPASFSSVGTFDEPGLVTPASRYS